MTLGDIQNLLNTLMRGIDKKTSLTVEQDPNGTGVIVRLARDRRNGSLHISEADLSAAETDLLQRNYVRTSLKRARDRMWNTTTYIFTTKTERQKSEGAPRMFPPMQGGGRGRR